jgi:HEAT repeat protein
VHYYVDGTVNLLLLDTIAAARALMVRGVAQAMAVKMAGLENQDEKIRQRAATAVVEWNLGKAAQALDVTHGVTEEVRAFMRELVELGAEE